MKYLTVLISISLITNEFEDFFYPFIGHLAFQVYNLYSYIVCLFVAWVVPFIAF